MNTVFAWLLVYIVGLLTLAVWTGRNSDAEDFLIAGRKRAVIQILVSKYAAAVGVSWFIVYTGYAYQFGWSVVAFIPGLVVSYLLFALWAVPRICTEAEGKRFYTQGNYVGSRTNSHNARIVADITSVVIAVLAVLITLIGGAKVIESLNLLSYGWALLLTSFVVMVYIAFSGFRGVLITDVVQGLIVLIFVFIIAWQAITHSGGMIEVLSFEKDFFNMGDLIGFTLFGLFSIFAASDRYQLCFAAKNARTAKAGMAGSFLPITLTFVLLIFIGLSVAMRQSGLDPDLVFLHFITDILPAAFLPFIAVLLFAGLMSSADTLLYIIGLYSALLIPKWNSLTHIRYAMIATVLVLTVVAFIARDVLDVALLAGGFALTIPIAMIYVIAGGRKAHTFIASVFGGCIGLALGIGLLGLVPAAAPFPLVGGLLGLFWPKRFLHFTQSKQS